MLPTFSSVFDGLIGSDLLGSGCFCEAAIKKRSCHCKIIVECVVSHKVDPISHKLLYFLSRCFLLCFNEHLTNIFLSAFHFLLPHDM